MSMADPSALLAVTVEPAPARTGTETIKENIADFMKVALSAGAMLREPVDAMGAEKTSSSSMFGRVTRPSNDDYLTMASSLDHKDVTLTIRDGGQVAINGAGDYAYGPSAMPGPRSELQTMVEEMRRANRDAVRYQTILNRTMGVAMVMENTVRNLNKAVDTLSRAQ